MSKKNRDKKAQVAARREARRLTPGKLLRLFLKSMAFALMVGILFTVAGALGLPYVDNTWVQFALILAVYLVAYPFLMSEFKPRKSER